MAYLTADERPQEPADDRAGIGWDRATGVKRSRTLIHHAYDEDTSALVCDHEGVEDVTLTDRPYVPGQSLNCRQCDAGIVA